MPNEVFHSLPNSVAAMNRWIAEAIPGFNHTSKVLLTVPQTVDASAGAAMRIQMALAEAAARVLDGEPTIATILAEGGATAAAICQRMNWQQFQVSGELAGGVVMLEVSGPGQYHLIVKPGSYPWPDAVWTSQS